MNPPNKIEHSGDFALMRELADYHQKLGDEFERAAITATCAAINARRTEARLRQAILTMEKAK
jgi:hypothetical protein